MTEQQLVMFEQPRQPRRVKKEPEIFYNAVMLLRRCRIRVRRAGRDLNYVNGKMMTNAALVRLASHYERRR